ncbi:MAG: chemotaxis protein CheD [Planctomycetota bacterium]|nr:chemotaxis protein CheD [Planctomycetota bacterium]
MPSIKRASLYTVGMGHFIVLRESDVAQVILGSCIGLALYCRRKKIAAVAHIVLPYSEGREGSNARFADQAIPAMLVSLAKEGVGQASVNAKLAGGANVLGAAGPMQIGKQNHASVKSVLDGLGIAVVAEHIGGEQSRKIIFNCATCELQVRIAGKHVIVL